MAAIETRGSRWPVSRILFVWMLRISIRPCSSGRLISTCTSSRPGRSNAESIRSRRFVMPMSKMLFSASTPSILVNNWLTILSDTPVLSLFAPRCLQIASISSKITMCNCDASPCCLYSFSASSNSFRMFSSDCPTYLFRISGPFTIFGSAAFKNFAICLAINVFPVPGGPWSNIPRTWFNPKSRMTFGGKTRDANALRNMVPNSFDKPPIPSSSKLKSGVKMFLCTILSLRMCSFPDGPFRNSKSV
mmetsp:Transcript_108509/g.188412  ORF Transcript_108509/g.188412 Transcript_108509/m.188412 type:complete len:247 (+) Transcript_108509:1013-1753(+)